VANDRGRLKAAPDVVPTTALSLLRDPDIVALIVYVGTVSREIGYWQAEADMAAAWAAAARPVQAVLTQPTQAELRVRRGEVRRRPPSGA